jgi:lysyl endopeptidase
MIGAARTAAGLSFLVINMTRFLLVLLASAAPLLGSASTLQMTSRAAEIRAAAPTAFHAPRLAPIDAVALEAPLAKAAAASEDQPGGRIRVATVRPLAKAARVDAWTAVAGGFVSKLRASSDEALGLRVRLDLGTVPGSLEVRAQGTDGRIETMTVDPAVSSEAWTPWTEGPVQVIEIFSAVQPSGDAVRLGAVLHFTDSPFLAKAAGSCTVSTQCAAADPALGPGVAAAIGERKSSVMKVNFVDGGSGFICSGTLINTEKFPAAYMLTANHCIDNVTSANSITTLWFYESTACDGLIPSPTSVQVGGGTQLVFTNANVDSTLLLMNNPPPAGAVYSGWNKARLASGDAIVSISHPLGDTSRYALGNITNEYRIEDRPQDMYGVHYTEGIIQGGSSGSGLFAMSGGSLQLRGILTGTTVHSAGGLSCTNLAEEGLYSRFELFEPQIDQYIRLSAQAADDAPNRFVDLVNVPLDTAGSDMPLNVRGSTYALDNRHIDYAGDIDVYRFNVTATSWVSVWTEGANLDTVGSILDRNGVSLETSDDVEASNNHAGITRRLTAGTYYFQVGHWDATGTGAYNVRMRADNVDLNYTDLWWVPAESGWGLNVNHQGDTVFATLFTYDENGAPMWLLMSNGTQQADGSFTGALYRSTGPVFNASPWTPVSLTQVGTMTIAFASNTAGTLTYTYNNAPVTKAISRMSFSTPTTCSWSEFDRSASSNFQDLWWNPNESGWGVNVTHQGNILFATLFTYAADRKGAWYVMSDGALTSTTEFRYSGALYRGVGPAFNAVPWTPITLTQVGNMTFTFTDGNTGTLTYSIGGVSVTKSIQRMVFRNIKTLCE